MGSLYGRMLRESVENTDIDSIDLQPYVELMAYDDISHGTSEQIKEFCESELAQTLLEKQVLNKSSFMRLSKQDDMKRRIKLVCYNLAREANDANFKKMCHYRAQMKMYRSKVIKKYAQKAAKIARISQKEYIKKAKSLPQGKTPAGVPTK